MTKGTTWCVVVMLSKNLLSKILMDSLPEIKRDLLSEFSNFLIYSKSYEI